MFEDLGVDQREQSDLLWIMDIKKAGIDVLLLINRLKVLSSAYEYVRKQLSRSPRAFSNVYLTISRF